MHDIGTIKRLNRAPRVTRKTDFDGPIAKGREPKRFESKRELEAVRYLISNYYDRVAA